MGGLEEINHKEHICITHGHRNNVAKRKGGDCGEDGKVGWEICVILSTILKTFITEERESGLSL